MFIYKITNTKNNKCYIGFDTKPEYKQSRWKTHQRECIKQNTKFYKALYNNINDFTFEIIETGFTSIVELAIAEISYIKKFDSKNNGLNSTYGGDGLGKHLHSMTEEEIILIKQSLSKQMTAYNKIKWADTTAKERSEMVRAGNAFSPEVNLQRGKSLSITYKECPELLVQRKEDMEAYWNNMSLEDKQKRTAHNQKNSLIGAAKVSKKIKVITPDGEEKTYPSKSAFAREHGFMINNILRRTNEGTTHKGWQGWILNE